MIVPARRAIAVVALTSLLAALGLVLPAAFVLLAIAAIVFVVLAALDLVRLPRRGQLDVTRSLEPFMALRSPARIDYAIRNASATDLRCDLADAPPGLFAPAPMLRNIGLRAQHAAKASSALLPVARGRATFGPLALAVRTPIGLLERRFTFDLPDRARVYPDLRMVLRRGRLAQRRRLTQFGLRAFRLRGLGGEFESLREWSEGDMFRAIDWKATARRGRVMVQQRQVERGQTVIVALDAGRLMLPTVRGLAKFEYALAAALSIVHVAALADDHVGAIAFAAGTIDAIAPRTGEAHAAAVIERLSDIAARFEESDYAGAFARLRRITTKRALVILFTDMFDPASSALVLAEVARLTQRHLVLCVLMSDEGVEGALARDPRALEDAYAAAVASNLSEDRRKAAAQLRAYGAVVLDVPAPKLSLGLVNAYVDIKNRGML